jgi:hypothetical protein
MPSDAQVTETHPSEMAEPFDPNGTVRAQPEPIAAINRHLLIKS